MFQTLSAVFPISLIHFLSTKIYLSRLVVAETFMLGCQKIVIEHQEIGILAHLDGTLGGLDAQLLGTVDGVAQKHFFDAHPFIFRRTYLRDSGECRNRCLFS